VVPALPGVVRARVPGVVEPQLGPEHHRAARCIWSQRACSRCTCRGFRCAAPSCRPEARA
jgi:hypothetical protein